MENGTILQNRYHITRSLGQGGMGAVYLAEDQHLGCRCAVKESQPDLAASSQAQAQARQQFLAEARILAQLDHPNLPKVSDYFSEGERDYLVMDFVEGEDLASALQRVGKPLPERQVLIWANQVLDALEYLHSQRPRPVIHRDIKPANLILTPQGKIKLVDFGLVKLLDPANPYTVTAMRGLGTREYAPLEQYPGAGHTDARSDLYALGATLYHLLTNVTPVGVHQRVLDPAKLAPPQQINPALSAGTAAAIMQAMEVRPDQRFQSAHAMRQALAGAPTEGVPVSPARRAPIWRWGALLMALLIMAGLGMWIDQRWITPPAATARPTIPPTPAPATATAVPSTATREPTSTSVPAVAPPRPPTAVPAPATVLAVEPSATPFPSRTPVPSPTTRPATPTPPRITPSAPAISQTPAPAIAVAVTLLQPDPGASASGLVTFAWEAAGALGPNQAYEVIFWKAGENPLTQGFGLAAATTQTQVSVDLPAVDENPSNPLNPGSYLWGVRLRETFPVNRALALVSEGRGRAISYSPAADSFIH